MTEIPTWWGAILLTLAAWRLFHLAAYDDILDRPRRYITRLSKTWAQEGDSTGENYRENLANWLTCPYCAGFWTVIVVWVAWLVFPTETVWLSVPWAMSAGLIGAHKLLSSE